LKSSDLLRRLVHNWPAKILSLAAAVLLVVFNNVSRLEERFFSVPLELKLPAEYVPAAEYPQQVRIVLRGESEEIFRIEEQDIRAYVDLSEHDSSGEYQEPVEIERRTSSKSSRRRSPCAWTACWRRVSRWFPRSRARRRPGMSFPSTSSRPPR
jgi:hypothetical protein